MAKPSTSQTAKTLRLRSGVSLTKLRRMAHQMSAYVGRSLQHTREHGAMPTCALRVHRDTVMLTGCLLVSHAACYCTEDARVHRETWSAFHRKETGTVCVEVLHKATLGWQIVPGTAAARAACAIAPCVSMPGMTAEFALKQEPTLGHQTLPRKAPGRAPVAGGAQRAGGCMGAASATAVPPVQAKC